MPEQVQIEDSDGIAILRLDRPPANAIDIPFAVEIDRAVAGLGSRKEIRAVVLTGTGAFFSSGLDLKVVPSYGAADQKRMVASFNRLVNRLYGFPHPMIAALNGHTVAGGLVLALACDYRVATSDPCSFGLTESRVGIPFPAAAISVVKAELTPSAARSLVLLGIKSGPAEMLSRGVVDELKPANQVLERALEVARDAGRMPGGSYSRIKSQLRGALLDEIRAVIESNRDPAMRSWLTSETRAAASRILPKRS